MNGARCVEAAGALPRTSLTATSGAIVQSSIATIGTMTVTTRSAISTIATMLRVNGTLRL